jgi:hypothetical protein
MKTTTLLLAPLLIVMGLQAKPENTPTESLSNIKTGTTIGHYAKPGAPIDMTYTSTTVNVDEVSDINITLSSNINYGTMKVELTFDDKLVQISKVAKQLTFQITPQQKTYTISLKAKSTEEGLFYIRLLTKIDKGTGSQLRSFAVPIYIGDNPKPRTKSTQVQKRSGGENLSISKAIETIEVVEE